MRKLCPLFVVICLLYLGSLGSPAARAQNKRGVTPEDYFSFKFVGDPHISPDGKVVAYVAAVESGWQDLGDAFGAGFGRSCR